MKFTSVGQEQKELKFLIALSLSTFKPNTFRNHNRHLPIPYHNATPRRMKALKAVALSMSYKILVDNETKGVLVTNLLAPHPKRPTLFNTPQDAAAWLLDEYNRRKEAGSGPNPERI